MRVCFIRFFSIVLLAAMILGCGQSAEPEKPISPEVIHSGDECHVCGMVISRFPGPKGEAYDSRTQSILKFCSTKELMLWALQPDNQANIKKLFVHDMAKTSWDKPDDQYMIDATKAWYVVGSNKQGSMGATLASFGNETDAKNFARQYDGKIIGYQQLSIDMLINSPATAVEQ